jgi:type I restriction enzyme S subunit
MEVKPGYKQTEVGVIPEDWEVRSIGQMFRLINGCAFKPEDWKQSGTPIIRIQNLNDPDASFNYSQAPVVERNRVEAGDLLFAWSGTIGTSFGARVWAGPSGVLNQHIFKVLMDEQQITLPFSLLVFDRVQEDIGKQAHGFKASFVHVKKSDLVKVGLPVPPLPEQRAIAAVLSDVDGLLGGLDRLIAKKRDLKQAAMQQLLTGQTRLPGFHGEWVVKPRYKQTEVGVIPEDWNVRSLQDSTEAQRPISYGIVQTGPHIPNGVPCLRVLDINDGRINKTELIRTSKQISDSYRRTLLKAGDLVIPLRGKVGDVGIIDEELEGANLTRGVALLAIRPELSGAYCAQFISWTATRKRLEQSMNGSALQEVPIATLRSFQIAIPSTAAEQCAIVAALSDMDAELAALEQRREKTRALKQAMMQELLTGKTRLVAAGGSHA